MKNFITDIPQVLPELSESSVKANKKFVELSWKPPKDCTAVKGPIGDYAVTLMGLSEWANETQPVIMRTGSGNILSARLENLIPYAQYKASVFVKRPSGAINPALSLSINFTTLSDGKPYKI
jgi:hypothetical protein